ncbi:hypothetical protein [Nostoc sp. MG11]|nr:hypothetical protein [Nostoc sp. MG11]
MISSTSFAIRECCGRPNHRVRRRYLQLNVLSGGSALLGFLQVKQVPC